MKDGDKVDKTQGLDRRPTAEDLAAGLYLIQMTRAQVRFAFWLAVGFLGVGVYGAWCLRDAVIVLRQIQDILGR